MSHKPGAAPWRKYGASAGRCASCGKLRFTTRRAAKHFARFKFPGAKMSAYECDGYWHVGHTPKLIVGGRVARRSWVDKRRGGDDR